VLHELSPIGRNVLVGLRQDRRKIWIVYERKKGGEGGIVLRWASGELVMIFQ